MPDLVIIRGDSYALRRPLYTYTVKDDVGAAFPLTDCTVRVTFKPSPTNLTTDTTDTTAVIKGFMKLTGTSVTSQQYLYLLGPSSAGTFTLRLTAAQSAALPPNTPWLSDVEITDANGEVFTWIFSDTLSTQDAYTNRTVDS
jgi:hypothetical protein